MLDGLASYLSKHGGLTLGGGVRLASAFPATGREDVLTGHAEHDE
jgi:hypothetical protein